MRKYNLVRYATFAVVVVMFVTGYASAQYWFQSGARATNNAGFNNGASVAIQTIYQTPVNGSLGFWVGETLSNGAFIQVGYEITNSSGYYTTSCTNATKSVYLKAGVPSWFWEYFTPGGGDSSFCGGIGPDGSAGGNGSFNTYSFKPSNGVWNAYFNNQLIGSVNLGTNGSGSNPPSALAEYADTKTNNQFMSNVTFKNLLIFIGNLSRPVSQAYSVVGYGKGSLTQLPNIYGVEELGSKVNYFVVGSSVHNIGNSAILWMTGYNLTIQSDFGNITGSGNYSAYASITIPAPQFVNISNGVREKFVQWVGTGEGSYQGNQATAHVILYGNVKETAIWQRQYYLNATTPYGTVSGSGWYNNNTLANVSLTANIVEVSPGVREVFTGWSDNISFRSLRINVNRPESIHAIWKRQYYLNVTTNYSNVTGSGWYDANTTANVSVSNNIIPINSSERLAFLRWSNGYVGTRITLTVKGPTTINAVFEKQYKTTFQAENSNGQNLTNVSYYNVSSKAIGNAGEFLFPNITYNVEYFGYKNTTIAVNHQFKVSLPGVVKFTSPVYNVDISARSVFGNPANVSVNITFRNKTTLNTYTGKGGTLSFYNVPYGYVTGYAESLGLQQDINLSNGASVDLTFFTISLMLTIVGGIILVVVIAKVAAIYENKREDRKFK
jgi:hypothetical protein